MLYQTQSSDWLAAVVAEPPELSVSESTAGAAACLPLIKTLAGSLIYLLVASPGRIIAERDKQ